MKSSSVAIFYLPRLSNLSCMEMFDKSFRELYQEASNWLAESLSRFDQIDLEALPWLEPALLAIAGLAAFYLAAMVFIWLIRFIGFVCFNLDQMAYWLAWMEKSESKPVSLVHVREFGRWRVQGYEPDQRKAAKRKKDWQAKLLTEREIREIEEKNRSKL